MLGRLSIAAVLVLALFLGWAIPTASADTATISGTLDAADPDMPVVFISAPNCTGQGVTLVSYESHLFTVETAGAYTLDLTSPANFASFYLYAGSFNPAAGVTNCVAADNSAPNQIMYALAPGTDYYVVVFDDQFAQPGGSYSVTISGPGNVWLGGVGAPGPDLVPIPSTAAGGAFVATTPAYFEPRLDAATDTILEAGKTVWVYGLDASGQFYKVMLAGRLFWVPVSTIGPNYDEVWQGRPLPNEVVS